MNYRPVDTGGNVALEVKLFLSNTNLIATWPYFCKYCAVGTVFQSGIKNNASRYEDLM